LEVNNIKTPLIIDTGASVTVVYRKTIVSGKVTPLDVNFKLETANIASLKLLCNVLILIKFGEIELAHNCLVADRLCSPILIGVDVIKKLKTVINLDNNSITFKKNQ